MCHHLCHVCNSRSIQPHNRNDPPITSPKTMSGLLQSCHLTQNALIYQPHNAHKALHHGVSTTSHNPHQTPHNRQRFHHHRTQSTTNHSISRSRRHLVPDLVSILLPGRTDQYAFPLIYSGLDLPQSSSVHIRSNNHSSTNAELCCH